jgi:hypothetical protein
MTLHTILSDPFSKYIFFIDTTTPAVYIPLNYHPNFSSSILEYNSSTHKIAVSSSSQVPSLSNFRLFSDLSDLSNFLKLSDDQLLLSEYILRHPLQYDPSLESHQHPIMTYTNHLYASILIIACFPYYLDELFKIVENLLLNNKPKLTKDTIFLGMLYSIIIKLIMLPHSNHVLDSTLRKFKYLLDQHLPGLPNKFSPTNYQTKSIIVIDPTIEQSTIQLPGDIIPYEYVLTDTHDTDIIRPFDMLTSLENSKLDLSQVLPYLFKDTEPKISFAPNITEFINRLLFVIILSAFIENSRNIYIPINIITFIDIIINKVNERKYTDQKISGFKDFMEWINSRYVDVDRFAQILYILRTSTSELSRPIHDQELLQPILISETTSDQPLLEYLVYIIINFSILYGKAEFPQATSDELLLKKLEI